MTLTHHLIQQFSNVVLSHLGSPGPLQRSQGPHCLCEDAACSWPPPMWIFVLMVQSQVAELLGSGPRHGRGSPLSTVTGAFHGPCSWDIMIIVGIINAAHTWEMPWRCCGSDYFNSWPLSAVPPRSVRGREAWHWSCEDIMAVTGSAKLATLPRHQVLSYSREPDRQPWRRDLDVWWKWRERLSVQGEYLAPFLLFRATSDFWNGNSDLWKLASESNSFLILKGCLLLKVMVILMSDFGI